ncbi:hypothetical protein [Sulfurovum sp.]|uniref:hypothetical protein n=1 Tax=Sulfurovum sp. TaxID=1969726 RepID=UPI0026271ED7|nr:hypothetical protein [Sulfurovum sp.]
MKQTMNFRKILLPLLMGTFLYASPAAETEKDALRTLPSHYNMIVAYYGRPHVKTMGILGEYPISTVIQKVKARARQYEKALGNGQHVTPGFDLIYEMATTSPGKDGKYVITLSEKKLMEYIHAAQENNMVLFIDVQLGKKSPAQAVKPLLKYLKYKNVHIAVDPEFSVDNLSVRPGKKIGSITGPQINAVQDLMSAYLRDNHIEEDKILLVHMFTENMVRDKKAIRYTKKIHLAMHLDGHGSPALKIKIYNGLYTEARAAKVVGGFKVFLKADHPVMTPRQVLGLEPVGKSRVKDMPKIITYQ